MAIPLLRGNPDQNQLWVSIYSQELESDALSRENAGYYYSCGSLSELQDIFDGLIRRGVHVSRLLFDTHGNSGKIKLGNQALAVCNIESWLANRNYETIFNANSRILCNGCNVAEGTDGSAFLQKMGQIYLRTGGGTVRGWTSPGFASFVDGHVMHFWGDLKTVTIGNGGQVISEMIE
ncbi:DUF4347 domain-containing protein [Xanthocytophaga flava]|uniref:DUF4347 domain-containing protein n=1 Tax=Xanthocytophaga flava TaxID=3048013 RepID=UPI0028D8A6A9|nr:DUF4347 domain-containing protein [Xanthocytophaga flavus]MDJ1467182.1 DUF4347 domain-containing protein [Xanthocytophaga flavus]